MLRTDEVNDKLTSDFGEVNDMLTNDFGEVNALLMSGIGDVNALLMSGINRLEMTFYVMDYLHYKLNYTRSLNYV